MVRKKGHTQAEAMTASFRKSTGQKKTVARWEKGVYTDTKTGKHNTVSVEWVWNPKTGKWVQKRIRH